MHDSIITRRGFMQIGALALGGLTLPEILQARAASGTESSDASVIMLYQHGGASQLETYDLKPDAPSSYRSVFNPIPTNVPGMDICELFPLQAKLADRFSLVRSLHHDVGIHSDGGIVVLTGKRPTVLDPTSQSKSEHPDFGSVASALKGIGSKAMPPYVAIPRKPYMTRPTYLGLHHSAFETGDPNADSYQPPQVKLAAGRDGEFLSQRQTLLQKFDRLRSDLDTSGQLEGIDRFQELAFELMTSPHVAKAFAIDQEPDSLRDRYGRNEWGQACLLARRLAESGTSVVNIYFNTPKTGQEFTNWDDHISNAGRPGHFAKYMRVRLPYMDQALSALIEDIFSRGLDRKVLVVVVGEFGRTPRLSHNSTGTGRNHWPQAYSALLSGGGLKMGQAVGATNSKAEYPAELPHTPQDLLATVYRHLGIDPSTTLTDHSGRPVHILGSGRPIAGLI
ncbi:MAG: DUF1501 domain-containing protein [Planctomycetota bacterium]|jgi:hypothetical protein